MIIWIGVHPDTFLKKSDLSIKRTIEFIDITKRKVLGNF